MQARQDDRRRRQARHPRRDRPARPHGTPLRRHRLQRQLRDRHPRRGLRRHHLDHRLRDPVPRQDIPTDDRRLAREGRPATARSTTRYHLAVTEYRQRARGGVLKKVVDQGITTFKLFLAYPGVFMVDDQTMFRVMRSAGEAGGLTLVHAENGDAITLKIAELTEGRKDRAEVSRSSPARPSCRPTASPARSASRSSPRRPSSSSTSRCEAAMRELVRARDARSAPRTARRVRNTSSSTKSKYDAAELRGREVRLHPAARRQIETSSRSGTAFKLNYLQEVSHRPLPVPLQGPKRARPRRLH